MQARRRRETTAISAISDATARPINNATSSGVRDTIRGKQRPGWTVIMPDTATGDSIAAVVRSITRSTFWASWPRFQATPSWRTHSATPGIGSAGAITDGGTGCRAMDEVTYGAMITPGIIVGSEDTIDTRRGDGKTIIATPAAAVIGATNAT